MGKVINCELCKKFKCDHTNKWCMHNPESVLENETHKILWEFQIETDHLISARRPDLITVNKKKRTLPNCGFCRPSWLQGKTGRKQIKDLAWELKRNRKRKSDSDTTCNGCAWYSHQRIDKVVWELGYKKTNRNHSNYGHNTKKIPGDVRKLVVFSKKTQLTLVWKTLKK